MPTVRSLIEARIRDQVTSASEVLGASSYMALSQVAIKHRSIYVVRLIAQTKPNTDLGLGRAQDLLETFGIFVATQNVRSASGVDAADENEVLCTEIQDALLGWQPDTHGDSLSYVGGQMVEDKDRANLFIWREMYSRMRLLES